MRKPLLHLREKKWTAPLCFLLLCGLLDSLGGCTSVSITGFSPPAAPHGALLRIKGAHFSEIPAGNRVTLNGVQADTFFATPSEITVRVPKNMACSGPVHVFVDDMVAVSSKAAFIYLPTASTTVFAGNGKEGFANGIGHAAQFNLPRGIGIHTMPDSFALYVADTLNHRIRKILPSGVVSTFAGSKQGAADGAASSARFNHPQGIAIDVAGNLYVADYLNHLIRKISSEGTVSTFAGSTQGYTDGTASRAQFSFPSDIAIDKQGNLYVVDTSNHGIRKISRTGMVSTFAGGRQGTADGLGSDAEFRFPSGITIDVAGNLYVADYGNHRIRKISPEGFVITLAGDTKGLQDGIGMAAQFNQPSGIAIDVAGNLYVADSGNNLIRKISPRGLVSTLVGDRMWGFADGADGDTTQLPYDIAIDAKGNLYVAESYRIRKMSVE